jgi:hypothetical protein
MRRIMRYTVFALCLGLGTSAWYTLAQKKSISPQPAAPVQATEETQANQTNPPVVSEQSENAPDERIKFGPVEPVGGYPNTHTIILRESADASAPISKRLKVGLNDRALILDATRDFLRVRFTSNDGEENGGNVREQDYEGWTTWASIVPDMSAIVLDAETGAVVARVPLDEGISAINFSPDSSRAIFYGGNSSLGRLAYEVQTSDYKLKRSLTTAANDEFFGTLFYAPADGALYATLHVSGNGHPGSNGIRLLRLGEEGVIPTEIGSEGNNFFIISPDGRTALRANGDSTVSAQLMLDVIDLATLKVRNTFWLERTTASPEMGDYLLNHDGSELYLRRLEALTIPVIDTRTGQRVRQLQSRKTGEDWPHYSQADIIGGSLLLRVWNAETDEMHDSPLKFWAGEDKRKPAEPDIDFVVEAGGKRYAVNADGTLLLKLDGNNRIQKRLAIDRPERRNAEDNGTALGVFGFSASPDGKHLILFLGMEHGC